MSSLSYINPTHTLGLMHTLTSAVAVVSTAKNNAPLYTNSDYIRGATDSLNIISAQGMLATATDSETQARATAIIEEALEDLANLRFSQNLYSEWLVVWPNAIFTAVFGILLVVHVALTVISNYTYFGTAFLIGCGLTFAGYLARCVSVGHELNESPFLCQFICLTISPAFIMAGLYYMLGFMVVFHGTEYSLLRPRWFSYIFISCDFISVLIQAIGGGVAGAALSQKTSTATGTHIMVGGLSFQVFSMTLFYCLLTEFVIKSFFDDTKKVPFSVKNFFALLFDTKKGQELRALLDPNYVDIYNEVRARKLFPHLVVALYAGTTFVYIRCVYRVIELSQGWTGFLITHQAFLMALDALQITLTSILFVFFHPYFVWGNHKAILARENATNDMEKNSNDMEKSTNISDGEQNNTSDGDKNVTSEVENNINTTTKDDSVASENSDVEI